MPANFSVQSTSKCSVASPPTTSSTVSFVHHLIEHPSFPLDRHFLFWAISNVPPKSMSTIRPSCSISRRMSTRMTFLVRISSARWEPLPVGHVLPPANSFVHFSVVAGLKSTDVAAFSPESFHFFPKQALARVSPAVFKSFSNEQLKSLNVEQIQSIPHDLLHSLSKQQMNILTHTLNPFKSSGLFHMRTPVPFLRFLDWPHVFVELVHIEELNPKSNSNNESVASGMDGCITRRHA